MNSRISWQQIKVLFLVQAGLALLLATADRASAISIKKTSYSIPSGAYFVSPDGKESNSGKSANSPWSVDKAITSAPSGSTIIFRGGTYRNVQSTIKKKLTLQAYPNEQAWLKGSVKVTDWVSDGGGRWRKNGWTPSFPKTVSNVYLDPKYKLADHRDMVYINGERLKQVSSKSAVGPGEFYVDYANDRLYIGSNPAGKTVEATALKQAFTIWKTGAANPSDTTVRGLGFAHYADMGLRVGAPRVKLENNTFVWNGAFGAYFWGEMGGTKGVTKDAIVRGNTFSYNARRGLGGNQAHNMLLEDNTFSYNNVERFAINFDAAGVKFVKTNGLIMRDNLIEHNQSTGAWFDLSSTNITMVNNVSRYNGSIGLFFEASHKAIIAGNLSYKNDFAGIMVSNSSSARVYNNTLAYNGTNFKVKDTKRNNENSQEYNAGIKWIVRDIVFKNNILSNVDGGTFFDASNCGTREQSTRMIAAANRNGYYRKVSSQPQGIIKWATSAKQCAVKYSSVDAFDSATGYETQALVIDNVATNPFFINEANGDYRLKADSKAIGRGEALPKDIANAIGVPAGQPVDLGALQNNVLLTMKQ